MTAQHRETVSLVACPDYEQTNVASAVRRAVDLLGGIGAFIRPADRVLIKPNLLKGCPPETAVTTHPEIVRAAIRLVREAGGSPLVGDSPGLGDLRRVCEKAGILSVIREEGAALVDFEDVVTVKSSGTFHRFEIARTAVEADAIVNLPKFKTHGMTILTGAVKNLFGCIPGKRKVQWHFNTGVKHDAFCRMLVDLSVALKPRLTIVDGVVGMEGNGPGSGKPRIIGAILAGRDPVAIDATMGRIAGLRDGVLPIVRAAADAGTGAWLRERIEVVGDPVEKLRVPDFLFPPQDHTEWRIPEFARRILKDALTTRPVITHQDCIRCGICLGHCPQRAMGERKKKISIDYRNCIRCFCCQEFCPSGAITVGRGWALKLAK